MSCKIANGSCRIFICYRSANIFWANKIYNWISEIDRFDFGEVYFSDKRANANFINDITTMLGTAEYVIIPICGAPVNFTNGFPETAAEYDRAVENNDKITSIELGVLFKRMYDCITSGVGTMPKIITVNIDGYNLNDSTVESERIRLLAGDFARRDNREAVLSVANGLICAGINRLDSKTLNDNIDNGIFEERLGQLALREITYRSRAAAAGPAKPLFDVLPQKLVIKNTQDGADMIKSLSDVSELICADNISKMGFSERLAIISGAAGMGKTTQLTLLCYNGNLDAAKNTSPDSPLFIYLQAQSINDFKLDTYPFYSILSEALPTLRREASYNPRSFFLDEFFDRDNPSKGAPRYCVCIDGIDEVDGISANAFDWCRSLFNGIRELLDKNVAVIVTTRSDELIPPMLRGAALKAEIKSLDDKQIIEKLPPVAVPLKNSPLFGLLRTPFYFAMYFNTVSGCDDRESLNKLYKSDPVSFFFHEAPTSPGELIWNYIMRNITRSVGIGGTRLENTLRSSFYLLVVLPELAAAIYRKGKKSVSINEFRKLYSDVVGRFKRETWLPFWLENRLSGYLSGYEVKSDPGDFASFCTSEFTIIQMKSISRSSAYGYNFVNGIMLDFFYTLNVINSLSEMCGTEYADSPESAASEPLPIEIQKLLGEITGERGGVPFYDEEQKKWRFSDGFTTTLLRRCLDRLRYKKDTTTLVCNIYNALLLTHIGDTRLPDLSGINFDGIDLSRCTLNNIIFSHIAPNPDGELKASFRGAVFDTAMSFSEGHQRLSMSAFTIAAMFEFAPGRLLSIDNTGCVVLWNTDYGLPVSKIKLFGETTRRCCVSDMISYDGGVIVACDGVLFKISVGGDDMTGLSAKKERKIPTRTVKHLCYHGGELYYYAVEAPLDRRRLDGKPDMPIHGSWHIDAVVNGAGDKAYVIELVNNSRLLSAGHVNKYVRNPSGEWVAEKTIISFDDLQSCSGNCEIFNYSRLSLNEKTKTLCAFFDGYVKYKKYGTAKANTTTHTSNFIIEYDIDKEQIKGFYSTPESRGICAMYFGATMRYFAAEADIYCINRQFASKTLLGGTGSLISAMFLPDTTGVVAMTGKPARVHIFDCREPENCRCTGQLVPEYINSVTASTFAFQFTEEIDPSQSGAMGLADYPGNYRLLLIGGKGRTVTADISNGTSLAEVPDNVVLCRMPVVSIDRPEADKCYISKYKRYVKFSFINNPQRKAWTLAVHPEWLFAGCDFTGAHFLGDLPLPELGIYAIGLEMEEEKKAGAELLQADEVSSDEEEEEEELLYV